MSKQTKLNKQVAQKSNKANKQEVKPTVHKDGLPDLKNPVDTLGGKIVIWLMIFLMGFTPLIGLIFYLVEEFM